MKRIPWFRSGIYWVGDPANRPSSDKLARGLASIRKIAKAAKK